MTKHWRVSWRAAPIAASARRAAMLLGGVAVPLASLLAWPAAGAPATGGQRLSVADSAEAWFATMPVGLCTTPLGCPPADAPASPYPADTLHVGVAGGRETARTYVMPDLGALPFDATTVSGTMTLPVATGTSDGTQSPGSAHIVVCLAAAAVPDGTQGSAQTPPKVDCSVSEQAVYDAKAGVFTVNLTAFLAAWRSGIPPLGLALLPDGDATQPTDAWQVTFNGRKRAGGAKHISSLITFDITQSDVATTTTSVSGPTGTVAPPPVAPPATVPGNLAVAPPAAPPVVAGRQPTAVTPQAFAIPHTVPSPLAFVIPLVLVAGALFFGRVFTRDATPLATRS